MKEKITKNHQILTPPILWGIGIGVFVLVISLGYAVYGYYLMSRSAGKDGSGMPSIEKSINEDTRKRSLLKLSTENTNIQVGSEIDVKLSLESKNLEIGVTDVDFNYNSEYLEVVEVKETSSFDRFMPPKISEERNRIFLTFLMDPTKSFKGKGDLATITFRVKKAGQTELTFNLFSADGAPASSVIDIEDGEDYLKSAQGLTFEITNGTEKPVAPESQ